MYLYNSEIDVECFVAGCFSHIVLGINFSPYCGHIVFFYLNYHGDKDYLLRLEVVKVVIIHLLIEKRVSVCLLVYKSPIHCTISSN